jgi:hypothetical protein
MRRAGLDACSAWARARINAGESVALEASLRRDETFDIAREARASFLTRLGYIALELPEAIRRVAERRKGGGHGADVTKLDDIHRGSLENLEVQVYDNSMPPTEPLILVLKARGGVVQSAGADPPTWIRRALAGTEYEASVESDRRGPRGGDRGSEGKAVRAPRGSALLALDSDHARESDRSGRRGYRLRP